MRCADGLRYEVEHAGLIRPLDANPSGTSGETGIEPSHERTESYGTAFGCCAAKTRTALQASWERRE